MLCSSEVKLSPDAFLLAARCSRQLTHSLLSSLRSPAPPPPRRQRRSLLVANGTALGVHALQGAELRQVAMYLAPHVYPVFTSQLSTIKNYILLGDVHKGASFLQWKDAPSQEIALLGSTPEDLDVSAGEFLVDGPSLTIAAVDAAGTTHTYSYEPGARELTWGGKRLLSRARFAGGPPPTRSLRFPCSAAGHSGGPRQGMLFCGLTGGVAAVVPIDPGTFAALRALEDALCAAGEALVPLGAGLNPKALRWPPHRAGSARLPMSGETMLDGARGLHACSEDFPLASSAQFVSSIGGTVLSCPATLAQPSAHRCTLSRHLVNLMQGPSSTDSRLCRSGRSTPLRQPRATRGTRCCR